MKQNKSQLILSGNMYKVLISLSIPIMINSVIQTLYNLVDGIWVSKISSVHFAATTFVWPINFFFIAIGLGISIAGTSLLSRFIGADEVDKTKEYASQLIAISTILSIVFAIFGYIFTPEILKMVGAEGDILRYGSIYLKITFLDMPFLFLYFNINSILTSQGDTITPTVLSGISAILNIILDPIFIFTFNMGIAGAAWATLISRALLALFGFIHLIRGNSKIIPNFRGFKFNKEILKEIFNIGLPASIGQIGASVGFMALNGFIVSYGTATMAAFGMVNRVTSLVMQPAMGVGSALTAVVGQNLGAENEDRANESYKKASTIALTIGIIGAILILVFNEQIVNLFIQSEDDPNVILESISYMKFVSISMPLMGMFSVYQGIFQGSGNTRYSMAMEIGRLWLVRLPMILIFKHFTNIGSSGIWFAMSFSNLIVCIYGYIMFAKNGWKRRNIKAVSN